MTEKKVIEIVESEIVLGTFLRRNLDMTRHQIRQAKYRENGICVNHERSYTNRLLHPGDVVEVILENPQETALPPCPMHRDVKILYEDEDLIVVTKPAGIVIHPSHGHYEGCLGGMIAWYYAQKNISTKVRPIGRLDKDTSGIMVFAKNQISAARLYEQKKDGRFRKMYLAIVSGEPVPSCGVIDAGICRDNTSLMKMKTTAAEADEGMHAVTHYKIVKRLEGCSVVMVTPETGRTHQIRVHMASIGHPLLGDPLYGGDEGSSEKCIEAVAGQASDGSKTAITRTALHAWKCRFYQPFTGEALELEADLPEDMLPWIGRMNDED